jgi:hypothetical protein
MDGELAAYSCGGSLGFGGIRLTEFPLSSGSNPENLDRGHPIRPGRAVKPARRSRRGNRAKVKHLPFPPLAVGKG